MKNSQPTNILLVRHGQTDWNLARRAQGHIDIPLNDAGRWQSERLASRLASSTIDAIYSSDLRRASETAAILGQALNLTPNLDAAFRERNGGIFQGLTGEELARRYPDAVRAFKKHGQTPPGGESNLDLARRAAPALERLADGHRGQTIILVTHGGTLRVLIAYLLGLPVGKKAPFKVSGNTGLTIAEVGDTARYITLLNDSCHLDDSLDRGQTTNTPAGDADYTIG
ncbi:MAG: histidine phosphatase family protein [Chloroflexota bacterium]|nr:MAG: histidine phosphatase family protein [Chloroflexota bacterium]